MVDFAGKADPGTTKKYKTGTWRTYKPILDKDACIGCEKCWEYCPDTCKIEVEHEDDIIFETDLDYCKGCGICAKECPVEAIEMELDEK
ncbi:Pyruvate:ferredoxin oxidoreductase delta subunit PorD [Methanonatronarchaeum thermophilum]|uniref:Ferredoxin n=1 Tax=Methanonatronarchaeum thermophilum TaxID=1927129 RepID=A0A1Y3GDD9_9EURY|nr:4Fe-4S dicluster-binding protein [Methanonatronarchaeum thermophilum]OUJ19458.1 Pyruvate:ferredoxin oxidoreductase delta subunit PorD [Methanonatronarchaeum thermophilum]